ncbi:hypothetical protein D6T64_05215 [Cryobacterium melibiosiphilum]|uniref:Uncharacterized protein n=1 Tax=Cryobacterium melibiosiphilum TaxID=995039 RepID=A0A3A5MVD4_9MICO|nr:hypothetical protein D6T64_05215 [Cryobacterium melibiosiphilum]
MDSNLLRPKDYDSDIADLVRREIGDSSLDIAALPRAMDIAKWDARDLIRTMMPVLTSFSGMLSDLLALYERIDATRTHKDNLHISYEFETGDAIDDQLAPFRERVQRTQTVLRRIDAFQFDHEYAWKSPLAERADKLHHHAHDAAVNLLGLESVAAASEWPFASEIPAPLIENPSLVHLVTRLRQVIVAALDKFSELGPTVGTMRPSHDQTDDSPDLRILAGDLWWLTEIGIMSLVPDLFAELSADESAKLVQAQLRWLERFWVASTITAEQRIEELADVLRLPYWGKRPDLYSAWVAAAIDAALVPGRLSFDVTDGVLAFPFRATLLARIDTANGAVELWTEKRFQATGLKGKGRVNHIQPDYVLINGAAPNKVIGVIEAKQYLNSKNHGDTAHDYAHNLSDAEVFIVAHGPLGQRTLNKVAPADRKRVSLHPQVRPGSRSATKTFADRLVALLPTPFEQQPGPQAEVYVPGPSEGVHTIWARRAGPAAELQGQRELLGGTVALRWMTAVHDLDLHLIEAETGDLVYHGNLTSAHAELGGDRFYGGPEVALFHPTGKAISIEVHLFSSDVPNVSNAAPVVTITTLRGTMTLLPRAGAGSRASIWHVATIEPDGGIVLGESIESRE